MDFGISLTRIADKDSQVWELLLRETARFARQAAARHRMDESDACDLAQCVRLILIEHVPVLREPSCLPGWLATTMGRQARRMLARRARERPTAVPDDYEQARAGSPESVTLTYERDRAVWLAAAHLSSAKARQLVWLLAYQPELTQVELAAELDLAPGSIGPLRKRSLDTMRKRLLADGFDVSDAR